MSDEFNRLPSPDALPTSYSFCCDFSADGNYVSIGSRKSPYINIYKRDNDIFTKLPNPSVLPTEYVQSCSFSPDSNYLAVACEGGTPRYVFYKREGDIFTSISAFDELNNIIKGFNFSADGNYLAISCISSPYIVVYKRNGDIFTRLNDPNILPITYVKNASFSLNSDYLAVIQENEPIFAIIYKRNGDVFTKLTDISITDNHGGYCDSCVFSPNGNYLAICLSGVELDENKVSIYKREGDVFTKLLLSVSFPDWPGGCSFSTDNNYFAFAHYGNDTCFTMLKRNGDVFTQLPKPNTLPQSSQGDDCSFYNDYFVIACESSPYIEIYKKAAGGFEIYTITDTGLKQVEKIYLITDTGLKEVTKVATITDTGLKYS